MSMKKSKKHNDNLLVYTIKKHEILEYDMIEYTQLKCSKMMRNVMILVLVVNFSQIYHNLILMKSRML